MKIGAQKPVQAKVTQAGPNIETEDVLVASKNIGIGASVTADNVIWKTWPKKGLSEGYTVRSENPDAVSTMVGQLARMPILVGEPIVSTKLVRSDRGFLSAILPAGMRAVAVRVNAASTAGGFILPEDRVDIMLVRQRPGGDPSSETILSNIRVLAIDQHVEQTGGEQKAALVAQDTATLALTPEQAELIIQAQQMGSISLALRSIRDADGKGDEKHKPTGISVVKFGVVSRVTAQQAQ